MEMLEKLDKKVKLPDAERELVKGIFFDLYEKYRTISLIR